MTLERFFALLARNSNVAVAISVIFVLAFMVVPVPPWLLDVLLALSLSVAVAILIVSVSVERPLEFSVFPTLLLITTLFRLALNVASTRLILIHGSEGPEAAGQVIHVFGSFVVGGNYTVGLILFAILVVINFVVITKGSSRIAEVTARFTLDALPGKQMSIDADLNSGTINEAQARERRRGVEREADFHGAMDGASKFVRGDAIAGLLITGINILGGLVIGMLQGGLDLKTAAATYTVLTVGDGLVAQIPALLISTAAGIVVTRSASGSELGTEIAHQLLGNHRVLFVVAGFLAVFGMLPGMPHLGFLTLALALVFAGRWFARRSAAAVGATAGPGGGSLEAAGGGRGAPEASPEEQVKEMLAVDLLEMELGYGLIPLVDGERGGDLLQRIIALRRSFASSLGILVPPVHIRDNLQLPSGRYLVKISGNEVAHGDLMADRFLAIPSSEDTDPVPGIPGKDPTFGFDALWVAATHRERAESLGYVVVEPSSVIATHLSEIIRTHAHELLGRDEVQELLEVHRKRQPKVVEELVPNVLSVGDVRKVLCGLLREGVSIRDLRTILETLADHATGTPNPKTLIELVRQRLARSITRQHADPDGTLRLCTLDPALEDALRQSLKQVDGEVQLLVRPELFRSLVEALRRRKDELALEGHPAVLLVGSELLRLPLVSFLERFAPGWAVLSHKEIDPNVTVETLGLVGGEA